MADQPARERKKPGRPARKAETPAERLARLEKDLAAARRAVKEAEHRKLVTVGRAVLAEAESNAAFQHQLHQVLRARVTGKSGLADIAGLLDSAAQPVAHPQDAAAAE